MLKQSERDMIYKSKVIKVPESTTFALVYAIPELVCKKKVKGKILSFLDEKMEGQGGRGVRHQKRGGQSEAALKVGDKAVNEVEVDVKTVLL